MSIKPLSSHPQPQNPALRFSLSPPLPLPSCREIIAQIFTSQPPSLQGRVEKRPRDENEVVFESPIKKPRTENPPIALRPLQLKNDLPLEEIITKKTVRYPNGRVYSGEFRGNLFHGYGTLTFAGGKTYTGDFENGQMHGFGKLTFSTGNYLGEFKLGRFHGQGTLTLAEGIYTGQFRYGHVYGDGMLMYPDGRTPIVGLFSDERH